MTSIIKFHALSGVQDESPPCYLLQVDEFHFLLDCGWDENFSMHQIARIKRVLHHIDGVLISYPDLSHLGALPYLVGKCGLNCPVYATVPVYKMGQMFMYDVYQSRHNTEDFDLFTLDDVDAAFDKMVQLKYSQTISLHGKGQGIQITPLPAGHMLGGTIWRIIKDGDEEIVYAIDYNHKKERHLNGCALDSVLRPSLLITDSYNAMYSQDRRRDRDEQLVTNILSTMRAGGNCLVAVDTAGRVLELAHLLDQLWRNADSGLLTYSLALLNNVCYNVSEFAKGMIEWMSEKILRQLEDKRNNPFQFRHVRLCHNLGELAQVPEPKVVLASMPDMECGFSRDLFAQWCKNTKNTVILTSRCSPGTLASKLMDNREKRISIDVRRRVKLDPVELEEYLREKQEKAAVEAALKARDAEIDNESEESDMEDEQPQKHDLMPQIGTKTTKSGYFKLAKRSYPMFPHHEERLRWDEYGQLINHSDYIPVADLVGGTTRRYDRGRGRGRGRGSSDYRGDRATEYRDEEEDMEEEEPEPEPEPAPEAATSAPEVEEVPTKCVSSHQIVDVNCKVVFIDFEGRSDGESIKKLLSQIKAKQIILVHGNRDSTEFLADYCRVTPGLVSGRVYAPYIDDIVDATTEGSIYQVKLKDSLMTQLRFYKARELELAWVDARIAMALAKVDTAPKGTATDDDPKKDRDVIPVLGPVNSADIPDHTSVFINEPKLSDLKTVLVKAGVQAEFIAGVLVCNNCVAVKRTEQGRIQIEGCLSEDYYKVRELIYDQYAIV